MFGFWRKLGPSGGKVYIRASRSSQGTDEVLTLLMGDLYLHLGFARRARFAPGLHPLAVEALVRAPACVVLGATLPHLPEVEHKGASFFRRLFMPGKQKRAFWKSALEPAGSPSLELALAALEQTEGKRPGTMSRFALGLGVLSHQLLHARVREVTADLEGAAREAADRALARIYLQQELPGLERLPVELKAVTSLDDTSAQKALLEHLNAALREAHGEAPGVETLGRWVRGLCAEVSPLTERPSLPHAAGLSDEDARARYGDALAAAVEDARRWFVFLANRISPLFLAVEPTREAMRSALVDEGDALRRPTDEGGAASSEETQQSYIDAVIAVRREHMGRGRNPKPAFDESGAMPKAPPAAMPPVPPEMSDPSARAPAHTQEVSVADIQAEASGFQAPAHTQEVSLAQIEDELGGGAVPQPPKHTQQVSLDDIQEELAQASAAEVPPPPKHTQQVSLDDIQEELASQNNAASPPSAPKHTQQVSLSDIQEELAASGAAEQAPGDGAPSTPELADVKVAPPPTDPSAPFLAGAVPVPAPPPTPAVAPPVSAPAPTSAADVEVAERAAPSATSQDGAENGSAEEAAGADEPGEQGEPEAAEAAPTAEEEAARGGSDPPGA